MKTLALSVLLLIIIAKTLGIAQKLIGVLSFITIIVNNSIEEEFHLF